MERLCHICHRSCRPGEDLVQGIPVRMDSRGVLIPDADPGGDRTMHKGCIEALRQPSLARGLARPGVTVERADVLGFLA